MRRAVQSSAGQYANVAHATAFLGSGGYYSGGSFSSAALDCRFS